MSSNLTQDFLPIKEIKRGVVITKDNYLKAVLTASSINLGLKSEEEKQAVLSNYQDFLNTLDFPIQIMSQSRKYNIKPYLDILEEKKKTQISELLKIQTQEYINFIKRFVENSSIMSKTFFVVISLPISNITSSNKKSFFSFLKKDDNTGNVSNLTFEENLSQLEQRVNLVENGLARSGIKSERLNTQELFNLYYRIFNPLENNQRE